MIYEKHIEVQYAETGVEGRLKPVMIFNYLQDVASDHAAVMGISALDMLAKNLAWVIIRYQVTIRRYPVWKDQLRLRTWRFPFKNLYELRTYEIRDKTGGLLISAKSSWVLTNLTSKKPVRLNKNLPPALVSGRQKPIPNDLPDLPPLNPKKTARFFTARMHDLDFNRHVNNAVYAVWAIESVPVNILSSHLLKEIAVIYTGESLLGDRISAHTQRIDANPAEVFLHSLVREASQKEITRVQTVWKAV